MLILTRRVGESLIIGDDVNVTVLGVKGNQVRLGVNAPKDISVHREGILPADPARKSGAGRGLSMSRPPSRLPTTAPSEREIA